MGWEKEQYRVPDRWSGTVTLLAAADVDKLVTSVDMKVGTYTIAAQPLAPSRVSVSVTAVGTADTLGTIVVVGTVRGVTDSETITPVAGSAVYGNKYFESITSITGVGWAVDEVEATKDSITVGISQDAAIYVGGQNISIKDIAGNIYLNPDEKATSANGYLMVTAETLNLVAKDYLYLTPDNSGATCKYIIWES
jgi:hypothetical protein